MTHEEMSNFTNEELENFRHLELSLEKTELLKNVLSNRTDIPTEVIDKLQKLCQDFIQSCEEHNIDIPPETKALKTKKTLTLNDIKTIVDIICKIIGTAMTVYSALQIQSAIKNIINIIDNQFINNINIIINEIEIVIH